MKHLEGRKNVHCVLFGKLVLFSGETAADIRHFLFCFLPKLSAAERDRRRFLPSSSLSRVLRDKGEMNLPPLRDMRKTNAQAGRE